MQKGTKGRALKYDPNICPFRHVLAEIGDKWSLLVIFTLKEDEKRFSEVKREIADISQRMLTQTLRSLERDGYVHRKVTPTIPPRVDYRLSDLGRSLLDQLRPISLWALDHREAITRARAEYDMRQQDT